MAAMVATLPEAAARPPTGPGFDILLVVHVVLVVTSAAVFAAGAVYGARGSVPGGSQTPAVRRFFAQATGRTGRVLYAIPASGAILVAAGGGAFSWLDPWLDAAASLWLVAAAVFELVAAPAERRTAALLGIADPAADAPAAGAPADDGRADHGPGGAAVAVAAFPAEAFRRSCRTVALAEGFVVVVLLAAAAVMTAKP